VASGQVTTSGYTGVSEEQIQGIFTVGDGSYNQSVVLTNEYGGMTGFGFISSNTDGTTIEDSVGTMPNTDEWYHVTVTRDGNDLKLYVDGELIKTVPVSGKIVKLGSSPQSYIGKLLNQHFSGKVDDVRVYKRALTGDEARGLSNGLEPMTAQFSFVMHFLYDASGRLLVSGQGQPYPSYNYNTTEGRLFVSSDPKLFLWWKLDEGTGSVAKDSSFFNHTGTLFNMESDDWIDAVAPLVNMLNPFALQFDGQSERVESNALDELTDVQEFTLSVWVNVDELPAAA
jgi:hypothetical protein